MQKRQQQQHQSEQIFSASEVAEFEYCSLAWWHERFGDWANADSEDLFARLVEMEHEHDAQAPALPEYQMIEQLLLRRGAFDKGKQEHHEHAEEVAEIEDERVQVPETEAKMRRLVLIALGLLVLALIVIALSYLLTMR